MNSLQTYECGDPNNWVYDCKKLSQEHCNGHYMQMFPGQSYLCDWDDVNNVCQADGNKPCDCIGAIFKLNDIEGPNKCENIKLHQEGNLYWPASTCMLFGDDTANPCRYDEPNRKCAPNNTPCLFARDQNHYATNTCTLGVGTTDHCTKICSDDGKKNGGTLLYQYDCEFGGYGRYCYCN